MFSYLFALFVSLSDESLRGDCCIETEKIDNYYTTRRVTKYKIIYNTIIYNHEHTITHNKHTYVYCIGKGGKNRRRGKGDGEESKRELEFKEEGQEYAQVVRMLGNGRCECFCYDGVTRLGHIRGKMRKKGAKGAPTAANFRRAAQTARKR